MDRRRTQFLGSPERNWSKKCRTQFVRDVWEHTPAASSGNTFFRGKAGPCGLDNCSRRLARRELIRSSLGWTACSAHPRRQLFRWEFLHSGSALFAAGRHVRLVETGLVRSTGLMRLRRAPWSWLAGFRSTWSPTAPCKAFGLSGATKVSRGAQSDWASGHDLGSTADQS